MFIPDYLRQPPAWFHTRILVGPGSVLTPRFVSNHNITHVINCAFHEDSPEWYRRDSPHTYACMEAHDSPHHNILLWYPKFEAYMVHFLRQSSGTIYVHCQAGMNRSAFLALIYVCKHFSMTPEVMIPILKRQRPCMFQNTVYRDQVEKFINGYLQSAENTRIGDERDNNGNTGLGTQGSCSEPTRLDVDTGELTNRTQREEDATLGVVCPE